MSKTIEVQETKLFDPTNLQEVEEAVKGLKFKDAFRTFVNNISRLESKKFDIQDFLTALNIETRWMAEYLKGEKIPILKTLEKMKEYFAKQGLVFDPLLNLGREELRLKNHYSKEEEIQPIVASAAKLANNLSKSLEGIGAVDSVKVNESVSKQTNVSTDELAKLIDEIAKIRKINEELDLANKALAESNRNLTRENADIRGENASLQNANSHINTLYNDIVKDHRSALDELRALETTVSASKAEIEKIKQEGNQKLLLLEDQLKKNLAFLNEEFQEKSKSMLLEAEAETKILLEKLTALESENRRLKTLPTRRLGLLTKENLIHLIHRSIRDFLDSVFELELECEELSQAGKVLHGIAIDLVVSQPDLTYEDFYSLRYSTVMAMEDNETLKALLSTDIDSMSFTRRLIDRYAFDLMQILVKML